MISALMQEPDIAAFNCQDGILKYSPSSADSVEKRDDLSSAMPVNGRGREPAIVVPSVPTSTAATTLNPFDGSILDASHSVFDHARQSEEGSLPRPQESSWLRNGGTPPAGCCTQLGSTIWRVLLLMCREPCSTACEFLIPILFVVGSVLIWIIFGTSSGDDSQYLNFTSWQLYKGVMSYSMQHVCYNASAGVIAGMPACDFTQAFPPLYCPEGNGIPAGFCYPHDASSGVPPAILGLPSLFSNTAAILGFDDLVVMQWCHMDSRYKKWLELGVSRGVSNGGKLYFSPDTAEVRGLIDYMRANTKFFDAVYGGIFELQSEADAFFAKTDSNSSPNWGLLRVDSFTKDSFDVSIRLNSTALPSTSSSVDLYYIGGYSSGNQLYLLSGFTTLQTMIYQYYASTVLGVATDLPQLTYTPMPTVAYRSSSFLDFGKQIAPLIIVLGYLYPMSQMTKRIVLEKELRIREAMLIMGLSELVMYLAWCLVHMVQFAVSSLIISIILVSTYLKNTNFGLIFFLMLFFSFSLITLAGLIASIFSKSRLAALLSPLIFVAMSIPLFATDNVGGGGKTGICFLSPSALAVGITILFDHESGGGAKAADLTSPHDNPKYVVVLVILAINFFLYLIIMVYLDRVLPKDWGTAEHPLFCILRPIRWCCGKKGKEDEDAVEDGRAADGVFEPVEDEASAAVRICGLRKKFKRGGKSFLAVNNLHWSLREGDISVLLGHNGAGKSTTMNLMTGMMEPDGGDCIIYGKSIRSDVRGARQEIGLCPQHNILWPNLTVREHLQYYGAIKGLVGDAGEAAVQRMMAAVDLRDKENCMSSALSGGQKRKLSVAVAFVGGSRLIFLDEPTAGMDVGARRHTWELLKEMAKHHTILLSTHFMDEADLLGNTVGIMSQGCMQCSGSNIFLKSQLGVGFVLTMSVVAHVDRARIEAVVRGSVPAAEPLVGSAGEVSYRLPMQSKSQFPMLLRRIEDGTDLGITAYSLSATTLEEIFLKIANGENHLSGTSETAVCADGPDPTTASAVWGVKLEENFSARAWMQFRAMMIKRFWNSLRDRRTQFFQIVCPVACILLAMLLTLIKFWNTPPLAMSSTIYKETVDIPVANCAGYLDTNFGPGTVTTTWSDVTTGSAFSQALFDGYGDHSYPRYGSMVCNGVQLPDDTTPYTGVFYNVSALHEVGIETVNFYSGYLRHLTGDDGINLRVVNNPMPKTKFQEKIVNSVYSLMISIIIMIPFTFIPSTFVGWIVKERQCKARHLQNVSGLNFYIYWLCNFLFDSACYIITMFLVIAVFGIFGRKEYIGSESIGATILIFFLYGISGILMAYVLSFLFNDSATSQNVVMLVNFIIGFLLVLAVASLQMADSTVANNVGDALRWIFRIVPSYCVGEGINTLATIYALKDFNLTDGVWTMSGIGWPCVYMAVEIPLFLFITLFVDHPGRRQRSERLFHNPDTALEVIEDEDPDVVAEREAVLDDDERQSDLVRVQNLRKVYSNGKVAVRNVTFGVKPGEVFGFLGTNGAGKTTTISILCQEFFPTSGHAEVCGYDIVEASREALQCIGYCPQFDACLDLLTVEEHLYLYAGVRGISWDTRDSVVEGLMRLCELTTYQKTRSHELSGGNRRKLSVAISLIGGPRVVFLDEPSAGMDPVARRGLWNAIETVADNCAIVLTTHHLEEVEALANRVAIMVNGVLHCIGDKTYLKKKFGTGCEVKLRVAENTAAAEGVKAFFAASFSSYELLEERSGRQTYHVPNDVMLSEVFMRLEENQTRLGILDYNVSQTSIEQVFMRISEEAEVQQEAQRQRELEEAAHGCCASCWSGCCH